MTTVDINREQFEKLITTDTGVVLVDFWASWCGPCVRFAPIFDRVSAKHPDVTFAKVDTEAEQELSAMAGIRSIPTLMIFRDGILLYNKAGALPEPYLEDLIAQVKALNMDDVRATIATSNPST